MPICMGQLLAIKYGWAIQILLLKLKKIIRFMVMKINLAAAKPYAMAWRNQPLLTRNDGVLDFVITSVLIIDHWGIVKADIGIKDGKIVGIGKAGNPDTMDGVDANMVIGASTEVHGGAGLIATAGGIDSHIHFICPQLIDHALFSGITTMIGGGTGPADGTNATTVTPGAWNIQKMLEAADAFPMNLGFLGKGNCATTAPLEEQIEAGAIGLKIHEDWGSTPAVIDASLQVADAL